MLLSKNDVKEKEQEVSKRRRCPQVVATKVVKPKNRKPRKKKSKAKKAPPSVFNWLGGRGYREGEHSIPSISLLSANDDSSAGFTVAPAIPPYDAVHDYMRSLVDPFNDLPVHIPEPGDNLPTEAYTLPLGIQNPTIYNGASGPYDGSFAFGLRGDSLGSYFFPQTISAAHAPTWTNSSSYYVNTYGSFTNSYYTRPVVLGVRVQVIQSGLPHTVTISSYRMPPTTIASAFANGPAAVNAGCTTTQQTAYGGKDVTMHPGEEAVFICNRGMNSVERYYWNQVTTDRTTHGLET